MGEHTEKWFIYVRSRAEIHLERNVDRPLG